MSCLDSRPVKWTGIALALGAGAIAALAATNGGPLTELHERGHQLASYILTTRPSKVTVDAWQGWSHVAKAEGIWAKMGETLEVISGTYAGGGVTEFGEGPSRLLGTLLGDNLTELAIASAGQGTTVMVHAAAVGLGAHQLKERPKVAAFLIAFGLFGHLIETDYALSVVNVHSRQLLKYAEDGHDFAAIADILRDMTGLHHYDLTYMVGAAWTMSVPTIGFGIALFI